MTIAIGRRAFVAGLCLTPLAAAVAPAAARPRGAAPVVPVTPAGAAPRLVATFDHQVTGVTVSRGGRIFVNFPRWTEEVPVSVAEVLPGGGLRPFPDDAWNAWRNTRKYALPPEAHFICVQSVVADDRDNLWVLDPAAPAQERVVPGGPKLVQIDLAANAVVRTIRLDEGVAPQGSYLNDVRFSPDGGHAYITDSGARGAIVMVDLTTGAARRVLDGHPSTQIERDVVVTADGRPLWHPDGRGVSSPPTASPSRPTGARCTGRRSPAGRSMASRPPRSTIRPSRRRRSLPGSRASA